MELQREITREKKNMTDTIIGEELAATTNEPYQSFNIKPGMSCWPDMPEKYKNAYRRFEKQQVSRARTEDLNREIKRTTSKQAQAEIIKDEMLKELTTKKRKKPMGINLDSTVVNFIDNKFFDKEYRTTNKPLGKILLIADVCGWAWWNKSRYLQRFLSDEFHIEVICLLGPERSNINANRFDVYFTYGHSYVAQLGRVGRNKRVTGITAHRPIGMLQGAMNRAPWLHANSLLLMKELESMANTKTQKCFYLPNGVDEELFRPVEPLHTDGPLVAGHVGKQCPAKGQAEFIIPAMNMSGVQSSYNINDYRKRLPYTEMWRFYQNMDVFMVASVEDGTPNGALEAAACGRPIISNHIGNMPELIRDGWNGFLVDRDLKSYVEKLKYLDKNRDHLVEMGKNARKSIEEAWTWKIQAENYRKMFKEIMKIT